MPPKKKGQTTGLATHPLGTEIYNTAQVAQALNVSVRTILRAIKSGRLKARKTGREFLMTREAVREYWESLPLTGAGDSTSREEQDLRELASGTSEGI